MSPKQALFVAEYLKDLNATQAAIRAGYSAKTADANAHRLMAIDGIRKAIAEATAKHLAEVEESAARTIQEAARVGYSDIGACVDELGRLKPLHTLPAHVRAAISAVKVTKKNLQVGDGVMDDVVEIKLWDKMRALDLLARYRGLLVEKVEVSGELQHVEARLNAARKKLAEKGDGKGWKLGV